MLITARDLSEGDEITTGVVTDINTGPTGLLFVEVAAYPGSAVVNTLTLAPVDTIEVV